MRILLVKLSAMGDVVHNLPVVADILSAFPNAQIDWIVDEAFADVVALHPGLHRVIRYGGRRWKRALFSADTRADVRSWLDELRSARYDAIIDTQSLVKSALVAQCARGVRVGWTARACRERWASSFYQRNIDAPRFDRVVAVERYRDLCAQALGYALEGAPRYGLRPLVQRPAWIASSGAYAVILTATSRDEKLWAEAQWIETIRALVARGVHSTFAWGNADERDRALRIAQAASSSAGQTSVAPDRLSLSAWASILAGASIAVGIDTGLVFLAAAVETPVVAIFVATAPSHVGISSGGPHRNLGGIGTPPTSEQVIDAALALMR